MKADEKHVQPSLKDLSHSDLLKRAESASRVLHLYVVHVRAYRENPPSQEDTDRCVQACNELNEILQVFRERRDVNEFLKRYYAFSDSFGITMADVLLEREKLRR